MAGYFEDTDKLDLGEHVFATPIGRRQVRRNSLPGQSAHVHAKGGGILRLEVTAQRLRENLGDAERWIYSRLASLLTAGPGLLAYEDAHGQAHAYDGCVLLGADAQVEAYRWATMTLDMACPETDAAATPGSMPPAPGAYSGTSTAQDYAAGGQDLGRGGRLTLEASRSSMLREIPRARGARPSQPKSGGEIRLMVEGAVVASGQPVGETIESVARSIGAAEVTLSGNGNSYDTCVLEDVSPEHTDWRHTTLTFQFVQDADRGGVS